MTIIRMAASEEERLSASRRQLVQLGMGILTALLDVAKRTRAQAGFYLLFVRTEDELFRLHGKDAKSAMAITVNLFETNILRLIIALLGL